MSGRPLPPIGQRIRTERQRLGWTQKQLADAVGVTRPAVTQWETEGQIDTDNLRKLAGVFRVSVDWLMTGDGPRESAAGKVKPPATSVDAPLTTSPIELGSAPASWPRNVPVRGTVVGGNEGFFELNGEAVDWVRRPPGIAHNLKAYAIYVSNDSMEPRFRHGELVYADPTRPAAPGCDVVFQLHAHEGEAPPSYIKRLVRRSATNTVFEQFNPRREVVISTKQIKRIDRILTLAELLGV